MSKYSTFKKGCKKQFQSRVWIYALHEKEPITIEHVAEKVEYFQKINKLIFAVILAHPTTTQSSKMN